jgi:hypothetical protein
MKKMGLAIVVISLIISSSVFAGVFWGTSGSLCSVLAEVIDLYEEGEGDMYYKKHFINLKILKIENKDPNNHSCPVKEKEVYKIRNWYYARNGYPNAFGVGDKVKSEISEMYLFALDERGPVEGFKWSNVKNEKNEYIFYMGSEEIQMSFESGLKPLFIQENDNENKNFIYILVLIAIITIITISFYIYRKNKN